MSRLTNARLDLASPPAPGLIYRDVRRPSEVYRSRPDGTFDKFEGNRQERRRIMKEWQAEGFRPLSLVEEFDARLRKGSGRHP